MIDLTQHLPKEILDKGTVSSGEWGWPTDEALNVVAAAESAGLICLGATLQYRVPEGIYEIYGIEFDVTDALDSARPYLEWVHQSASLFRLRFQELQTRWDFVGEAMNWPDLRRIAEAGQSLKRYECFQIDIENEASLRQLEMSAQRWRTHD